MSAVFLAKVELMEKEENAKLMEAQIDGDNTDTKKQVTYSNKSQKVNSCICLILGYSL